MKTSCDETTVIKVFIILMLTFIGWMLWNGRERIMDPNPKPITAEVRALQYIEDVPGKSWLQKDGYHGETLCEYKDGYRFNKRGFYGTNTGPIKVTIYAQQSGFWYFYQLKKDGKL